MVKPEFTPQSFTVKARGRRLNVLETTIGIGGPIVGNTAGMPEHENLKAIWDTGATGSVINTSLAARLNLNPVSATQVQGANGLFVANIYFLSFYLPNRIAIPNLRITEGNLGDSCDILIGMDIIGVGDFAITNLGRETWFSFRIPSVQRFDFVTQSRPAQNCACTCGSGKRYEKCCKKIAMEGFEAIQ